MLKGDVNASPFFCSLNKNTNFAPVVILVLVGQIHLHPLAL